MPRDRRGGVSNHGIRDRRDWPRTRNDLVKSACSVSVNTRPLRIVIFDGTHTDRTLSIGLTRVWSVGAWLYRRLGWIDLYRGVSSWEEALRWLNEVATPRPIAEIQFWGHGKWGRALIGSEPIDRRVFEEDHPLNRLLCRVRDRLLPQGASLFWFRTCETFGADSGREFAAAWAESLGCAVAGHTHIIGLFQSGLCTLASGAEPHWSRFQGIKRGSPERPEHALRSAPWSRNTITCFHRVVRVRTGHTSRRYHGHACVKISPVNAS